MRTSGPLPLLAAAAEALDEEDLATVGDAALASQLRGLWVGVCRLQAQLSRRVAVFDERGAAARDGARSIRDWLRHRLRVDAVEAGRQATVAAAMAVREATAAAYLRGEISADHVAAIDEAGWLLGDEAMARGVERIMLEHARRESPGRLRRLSRRLRERGDPRAGFEAYRRVRAHRFLDVVRAGTGAVTLRGQLDAGDGEILLAALAAQGLADPGGALAAEPGGSLGGDLAGRLGAGGSGGGGSGGGGSGGDAGGPERARADALVALCRTVLRAEPGGGVRGSVRGGARGGARDDLVRGVGDRPRVTVTVPLETLRGADSAAGVEEARLGSGEPVPAATARRLACDARVLPAVLGGAGEVLDIGAETETVTQGLRRAAELRDRGCRFPGCGIAEGGNAEGGSPAGECETHYVEHWSRGGPSVVDNVLLLCPHHHVLVHEGGWQVNRDPFTGVVRARRPDGTRLDTVSPPPDAL